MKALAPLSLMVIDDDPMQHDLLAGALQGLAVEIRDFEDPVRAIEAFRQQRSQVVLLDLMMPSLDGIEALKQLVEIDPATEVILMTAHYSTESAVEAIRFGATDYLKKPLDLPQLRERVLALIAERKQRRQIFELDEQLRENFQFQGIVGRSPLMLDVYSVIRRIAPHYRSVLLHGPTGTGKELVANAVHSLSPVRGRPLVVCNCSALTQTLLESELFGHVKGAFTGAVQDKAGLFEHAHGGALFLDEVGELPLTAQPKLLRVLQNQEIQRVGSPATRKIDVRIIAATNRDLRVMANEGGFREDLYYRLSMVEIGLPSLRDRKEDLPLLQRHFVRKFSQQYGKSISGISRRAQVLLSRWNWPGNIREMENVIGNACMMTQTNLIDVSDLPSYLREPANSVADESYLLEDVEQSHVQKVLRLTGGDKSKAAAILGISRTTLYNMLSKLKGSGSVGAAD